MDDKVMKVGPELDLLVAEKVMGEYCAHGQQLDPITDTWTSPKPYSSEISAAWEVVEKMKHLEWTISVD
jgi:hypothetical protein